jgi:hypothetical protein
MFCDNYYQMKNNKDTNSIGYCALYCGNCVLRSGGISDLARELLEKFQEIKFEKWAKGLASLSEEVKAFENYESCCEVLKAWDAMRCEKLCKDGGGSSNCKIRLCCREKNLEGCWECEQFEDCETLARLKVVNGELNINNIKKIRTEGIDKFIEEMEGKEFCDFYETKK